MDDLRKRLIKTGHRTSSAIDAGRNPIRLYLLLYGITVCVLGLFLCDVMVNLIKEIR